jgi:hypothetical protein
LGTAFATVLIIARQVHEHDQWRLSTKAGGGGRNSGSHGDELIDGGERQSASQINRGPTTEALGRPEPQKSARRLRDSIDITLGHTVLGGPAPVHELADRTIDLFGVQAAKIHPYQQGLPVPQT